MGYSKHGFLYHYFNMANSNPQYLNFEMTNADKKYTNANDHNVFIQTIENDTNYSVDEYTLDGKFVRHIFTNLSLIHI